MHGLIDKLRHMLRQGDLMYGALAVSLALLAFGHVAVEIIRALKA